MKFKFAELCNTQPTLLFVVVLLTFWNGRLAFFLTFWKSIQTNGTVSSSAPLDFPFVPRYRSCGDPIGAKVVSVPADSHTTGICRFFWVVLANIIVMRVPFLDAAIIPNLHRCCPVLGVSQGELDASSVAFLRFFEK